MVNLSEEKIFHSYCQLISNLCLERFLELKMETNDANEKMNALNTKIGDKNQ